MPGLLFRFERTGAAQRPPIFSNAILGWSHPGTLSVSWIPVGTAIAPRRAIAGEKQDGRWRLICFLSGNKAWLCILKLYTMIRKYTR